MSKVKVLCPFSRKPCRECGIFRGRHSGLCYFPAHEGRILNREELEAKGEKIEKPKAVKSDPRFEFPEIPDSPGRLVDIEDFIERRGT